MEIGVVIFAVIFVAALMFFVMRGFFASSQFEKIIARYPAQDTPLPHYSYFQSGMINGLCINGALALSVTEDRLYLKTILPMPRRGAASIPLRDLNVTEKRALIHYTIVKIKDSEWVLGLGSGWINKIKEFQSVAGYGPQLVAMHTLPLAARLPSTAVGRRLNRDVRFLRKMDCASA